MYLIKKESHKVDFDINGFKEKRRQEKINNCSLEESQKTIYQWIKDKTISFGEFKYLYCLTLNKKDLYEHYN